MTIGLLAFLLGLFGVPLVLLAWGHKLRKRGPRSRAAFWGAVAGHISAGSLALVFAMFPPEAWAPDHAVRGFFGLWALLVFPLLGAGVTGALTVSRPEPSGVRLRRPSARNTVAEPSSGA